MKLSFLLTLLFSLSGGTTIRAESPQNTPSTPQDKTTSVAPKAVRLTVIPREGMKQTAPDSGKYECGQIDLLQMQRVERTFTLKNETGTPVALDAIRTSCGCQSSVFSKTGRQFRKRFWLPVSRSMCGFRSVSHERRARRSVSRHGRTVAGKSHRLPLWRCPFRWNRRCNSNLLC